MLSLNLFALHLPVYGLENSVKILLGYPVVDLIVPYVKESVH
jgi:hypothetical protein